MKNSGNANFLFHTKGRFFMNRHLCQQNELNLKDLNHSRINCLLFWSCPASKLCYGGCLFRVYLMSQLMFFSTLETQVKTCLGARESLSRGLTLIEYAKVKVKAGPLR